MQNRCLRLLGGQLAFRAETRLYLTVLLGIVLYFIASNIGSGWIYLLSAGLLASAFLGIVLPLSQVLSVGAIQKAPRDAIAGQDVSIQISLHRFSQHKLCWPIRWLKVSYDFGGGADPGGQSYAMPSLSGQGPLWWRIRNVQRGVYRLGEVIVQSCYPLGFAFWQRHLPDTATDTITIYPRTVPIDGFFLYKLPAAEAGAGSVSIGSSVSRLSTFTRGVREYAHGDSPRIVHWASSARAGRLLVREFESEGLPRYDVLLDLAANWTSAEQFELAVITASSLLSLAGRLGIDAQLYTNPDASSLALDIPPALPGIQWQMEVLARVMPVKVKGQTMQPLSGRKTVIAVTAARSEVTLPTGMYLMEVAPAETDSSILAANSSRQGVVVNNEEALRRL